MPNWITDGSTGFTISGNSISFASEERGTVFNCMWLDDEIGVSSGKHYWKINFETLSVDGAIGLTSKDYFKQGWALKGLCYKGNLSDGSALLVSKFGPPITAGDTVGILASFEDDRLKVYLDINGKSLGLAFDVPASSFKSVFPIVKFYASGSVTCRKEVEIPNLTDRVSPSFTGIEGDWKLIELKNENSTVDQAGITSKLTKISENSYNWSIKTSGLHRTLFSTRLLKEGQIWKTSDVRAITDRTGSAMSTYNIFENLMKMVKVVQIEHEDSLSIESEIISSKWIRYDPSPGPYVTNVFPN